MLVNSDSLIQIHSVGNFNYYSSKAVTRWQELRGNQHKTLWNYVSIWVRRRPLQHGRRYLAWLGIGPIGINDCRDGQEILCLLWNPEVHCRIHKSPWYPYWARWIQCIIHPVSQTSILISFFLRPLVLFSVIFSFFYWNLLCIAMRSLQNRNLVEVWNKKNRAEFVRESPVVSCP